MSEQREKDKRHAEQLGIELDSQQERFADGAEYGRKDELQDVITWLEEGVKRPKEVGSLDVLTYVTIARLLKERWHHK